MPKGNHDMFLFYENTTFVFEVITSLSAFIAFIALVDIASAQ